MHKKIEIQDLDIPKDDVECWNRYPKHRWVYDLSRLLDVQNIKWSPFYVDLLPDYAVSMYLESTNSISYVPAWIYIKNPSGKQVLSEIHIIKGDIRHIRYIDKLSGDIITESVGDIEIRINAFITIHFQKFTGIITTETIGNGIYSIRLRPMSDLALSANTNITKLIKRIYKKNNVVHISGLTDHTLHDTIAS